MFLGLRTVVYHVDDRDHARAWYSALLGMEPYFDEPFYVGFEVGGFELGLDPNPEFVREGIGGVEAYWGVADIDEAYARLLDAGATKHTAIREVGGGIKVATVLDPFGNVLGVIENPHFKSEAVR
jgi:predicted enzyme related to lactoylglutathione lyase